MRWNIYTMECPFNNNSVVTFYILTEGTTNYQEATGDERFKFTLSNLLWNVMKLHLQSYLQVKNYINLELVTIPGWIKMTGIQQCACTVSANNPQQSDTTNKTVLKHATHHSALLHITSTSLGELLKIMPLWYAKNIAGLHFKVLMYLMSVH